MEGEAFFKSMNTIVGALIEKGYNPYVQLTGYVTTGNAIFITRDGGAREAAEKLEPAQIRAYLDRWDTYQDKKWRIYAG